MSRPEEGSDRTPTRMFVLRGNIRKLVFRSAAVAWPPNFIVLARNGQCVLRSSPWDDHLADAPNPVTALEHSLRDALRWLRRAQDAVGSGGVGSYNFFQWSAGYPEVTGYIIPTFWDCHHRLGETDLAERAVRMADWELGIQKPGGGWEAGTEGEGLPPIVFNTAQVIRGLTRTYVETGEERFLDSAVRAADWIVSVQEPDGTWTQANHLELKRVYDSYVSAALAQLYGVVNDERYAQAATRNCEFVLRHQRPNGWFELCDNSPYFNAAPSTHTLSYTIDGLLETGELLGREDFAVGAAKSGEQLAAKVDSTGYLAGRFDEDWQARVKWSCLTGTAQAGVICGKLYRRTGATPHREAMLRIADFLVYMQRLNAVGKNRVGGLPGSFPIWGSYAPLRYPCWAAKYFIDLILGVAELDEDASGTTDRPALTSAAQR